MFRRGWPGIAGLVVLAMWPQLAHRSEVFAAQAVRDKASASDDEFERGRQLLMANPRRARENYAPDFTLQSSAGETISLEGPGFHEAHALRDAIDQQIAQAARPASGPNGARHGA